MRTVRAGRALLVGAAVAVPTLALVGVATFTVIDLVGSRAEERGPATLLGAAPEPTYSTAPQDRVDAVHGALHRIGDACTDPGPGTADGVREQVSVILEFVRRHPEARFEIDDESGTSVSLLVVLQDELPACAPTETRRVQALLPPDLRRTTDAPR